MKLHIWRGLHVNNLLRAALVLKFGLSRERARTRHLRDPYLPELPQPFPASRIMQLFPSVDEVLHFL